MDSSSSPISDYSQIGRYGTISLLKQNDPNLAVTSFGIDTEILTFGTDKDCSIRLFYPDVSPTHCKINFRDRKAFLVILGSTGLVVDGSKAYPTTGSPTTIPLLNNSIIEIHGKRFRFSYPPKERRAQLYSTPPQLRKRALRLSMIQSAEVFTPGPSSDPMENLRVLQSPLRSYTTTPSPSPSTYGRSLFGNSSPTSSTPDSRAYDPAAITLVDGNNPCVVEADQDLVILEDVEVPPTTSSAPSKLPPSPARTGYKSTPPPILSLQVPPVPPVTPRSRPSLHRAVLIRSAQRVALKAEIQREEEEEEMEEMEVFGTIFAGEEEDEEEDEVPMPVDVEDDESSDADMSDEDESSKSKGSWGQSFSKIWPFNSRSPSPTKTSPPKSPETQNVYEMEEVEEPPLSSDPMVDSEEFKEEEEDNDEAQENVGPLLVIPGTPIRKSHANLSSPIKLPLRGLFMTPQPSSSTSNKTLFPHGRQRMSFGGQAMRVKVEEKPWKVEDIVLPIPAPHSEAPASEKNKLPPGPPSVRLSDAERAAIRERRRSALKTPETFFGGSGGIPGIGNSSPIKRDVSDGPISSPFKARRGVDAETDPLPSKERVVKEDDADARTLLERMKGAVEDMKSRRASMSVPLSPTKGASHHKVEERAETVMDLDQDQTGKEFSLLRTPDARHLPRKSLYVIESSRSVVFPMEVDEISSSLDSNNDDQNLSAEPLQETAVPDVEMVVEATAATPALSREDRTTKTGAIDTPSLADDEASPVAGERESRLHDDSDEEKPKQTKQTARIMRGRGQGSGGQEGPIKPPSKTRARAGSTAKTSDTMAVDDEPIPEEQAAPPEDDSDANAETAGEHSCTAPRSRSRSKVPTPPPDTGKIGTKRTTRRARTIEPPQRPATQQSEDEGESSTAKKPQTRRRAGSSAPTSTTTRRTTARTAAATSESSEAESNEGRKTRTVRTARAGDSDEPSASQETPTTTGATPAKPTTKRGGRRTKAAGVPPPIPETVKEEENAEVAPLPPQKKASTRSRKMGTDADNIPTTTSKSRSAKKGRAGVVAVTIPEPVEETADDKENSDNEVVVTKTRAGRPRKGAATKVKEETVTEPELGTGTRTTRGMRTRSRT